MGTLATAVVQDIIVTSRLPYYRCQLRDQVAQLRAKVDPLTHDRQVSSERDVDITIISSSVEVDQSSTTSVELANVIVSDVLVNPLQSTQPVASRSALGAPQLYSNYKRVHLGAPQLYK